ncbi:glycolate oxidase subunit GlcF [Duganella radicis]|uniref:Glycolate oxidase iron-sulfur subunit n=1 Tax=Duganella radicis TaxID=551988 RepID=A0A6L6PQ26_9BURK|nr:glycolate oxidase subunit GlcF [Duganella radicis]MTV41093.1 glycolate oxidase subunit GlcF [Duganella radicis]
MQTSISERYRTTPETQDADGILRSCVHCGFCTATCPTYQLTGDELDGPRGRIYLMKQVLEGRPATRSTQLHLDRCLTCRSCETTCPSGVEYGKLLDIGRRVVDHQVSRPLRQRLARAALRAVLPRAWLFKPVLRSAQMMRPLLPSSLRAKVPTERQAAPWPQRQHARRILLLDGCVQPALAPSINVAAARVLDAVGVQLIVAPKAKCCGAIRHHLDDQDGAMADARRNIDAWWPWVEGMDGGVVVEAILMTASGCGAMVKDYAHLLRHDPVYADKAARISALTHDLSTIVARFKTELEPLLRKRRARVVYHPPCTLQHGQQVRGQVEELLRLAGVDVHICADSHLCCGSAGTYSMLQPALATKLRDDKLAKLGANAPDMIVSANIGCLTHLQSGTDTPVRHWIELLDAAIDRG